QIDAQGNINLTVLGDHANPDLRLPGAAGSGMLYYMTKRVILFRMEHTKRVFVEKVDFITSPGSSDERVHRPGGPTMLITPLCVMGFSKTEKRFILESVHEGVTVDEVVANTGFSLEIPAAVPQTAPPTSAELSILRTVVKSKVAGVYPAFIEAGGFGG
ncbi:MAG: CoA synthetase, partial [Chloroflexi bacterium]|nr:CoA synthetase [Chloroflexota bacterium]